MIRTGFLNLFSFLVLILAQQVASAQSIESYRIFKTSEARQGVAAGREFFYTVYSTS